MAREDGRAAVSLNGDSAFDDMFLGYNYIVHISYIVFMITYRSYLENSHINDKVEKQQQQANVDIGKDGEHRPSVNIAYPAIS